jgi:glycosyltransferase involved in cell wall biosynthesis
LSKNRKGINSERKGHRILWLSFQNLDEFLSKTAYIEICKQIAGLGNQVDFFAMRSKKLFKSDNPNMHLFAFPLRTVPIVGPLFYVVLVLIFLPFYLLLRKPDFVITEPKFGSMFYGLVFKLFPPSIRPLLLMDIRSTPVVVTTFRDHLNSIWFSYSVIIAKAMFDGFTVATKEMKNELCFKFQVKPGQMYVWKNGVDLKLFSPEKYDRDEMRKKLGLTDKFVIFYHGSFRLCGIVETIKSVKLLEEKYPDLVFFLLGAGGGLKLYERIIQEDGIGDRVVIHSPVDYEDVPKYIAIADVGIVPLPDIPDWRNQSPLKLIEYLAMRKTVIATDIPANREFIGADKCGIYLSSVAPEEIAKAIEFVYERKEELGFCEKMETTVPIKDYDWRKIAENFECYLQEFAKTKYNKLSRTNGL